MRWDTATVPIISFGDRAMTRPYRETGDVVGPTCIPRSGARSALAAARSDDRSLSSTAGIVMPRTGYSTHYKGCRGQRRCGQLADV